MIKYPSSHVCFLTLLFFRISLAMAQNTTVAVNVGVVLDFDSLFGKIGLSCINMALSDFYASHAYYKTRLVLHKRDSMRDVVVEAAEALDLINNVEVQAMIIGSESSMQANYVIELGNKTQVPIISFSTTSPSPSDFYSPYYFRVAQNYSSQVMAISSIIQAFRWSEAVPIYVGNEFGEGVVPYLTNGLHEVGAHIPHWCVIPPMATDDQLCSKLHQLMTMQTRVFIVHMLPSLGSRFFAKAKEIGMMSKGYVWIMTDGMTNSFGSIRSVDIENLQGVLGIKTYVPSTEELDKFTVRWLRKFQKDNPTILNVRMPDVFGLWAYDASWALAMAVEKVGAANFSFQKVNISDTFSDLERLGITQSGPELSQALSSTIFIGLSGNFSLLNGQLQASNCQIVNVNGNGEREIGYWTPQTGLVRSLNSTDINTYSTDISTYFTTPNASTLGPILWPGETNTIPKGWQIPTPGMKLKVLVPVNNGFKGLVNVMHDPTTNTTNATGYCIDIFFALLEELPYPVPVQFYPFAKPNGEPAGNYNDLVHEVFLRKYDAALGDISARADWSLYVDFTLPYTDSGISMIVPIKYNKDSKSSAWVFLQPLTLDLWVTSGCFFIFIGFVIWVLEHGINKDFRGPPHQQIGTSFWFSFSTMVFAHRERVVSNLARFVVIVWCFVVLVLTQSYTASLSSLLTVQQLQPTDVYLLLKNRESIGYRKGSLVHGMLMQLGFSSENLMPYRSKWELDQLFEKGLVSAAFDETPYVKLFLSTYCSKYTTVAPNLLRADGFGFAFVFPKGSPLTREFSRVISNVQGNTGSKLDSIEHKWFKQKPSCLETINLSSTDSSYPSPTLSLDSFRGLFLVAGFASSSALLIFVAMFLYQHGHLLIRSNPDLTFWSRICILFQIYDQEDDISSHTIRQCGPQESIGAVESSPSSPRPSSSHSSHSTASHINVLVTQETSSTTQGDLNPNGQATQRIESFE